MVNVPRTTQEIKLECFLIKVRERIIGKQKCHTQDTFAFLKMIQESKSQYLNGEYKSARQSFNDIRNKIKFYRNVDASKSK